ncbi:MAG: hypothetical protein P4L40_07960 [Terracidiphilus sp.]|nr:hypothetical protein [Terracidiphilus sp.]
MVPHALHLQRAGVCVCVSVAWWGALRDVVVFVCMPRRIMGAPPPPPPHTPQKRSRTWKITSPDQLTGFASLEPDDQVCVGGEWGDDILRCVCVCMCPCARVPVCPYARVCARACVCVCVTFQAAVRDAIAAAAADKTPAAKGKAKQAKVCVCVCVSAEA